MSPTAPQTAAAATPMHARVLDVVKRYWGFDALRGMQEQSIASTLAGRDSLTVMPTGGGKSLCYQVPPLVTDSLTLVVSPLIALMQDQVASLRLAGVPAAAVHGNATETELSEMRRQLAAGTLRLLFVAPERLFSAGFVSLISRQKLGAIAIDEAHCISQWGHDFRPEYRRLAELRSSLRDVPLCAYTATATPRVREDIVAQLQLKKPVELVGTFDRPNLTYRVLPRVTLNQQVAEALSRHHDQAAIVYCISRKDTESLAADLRTRGLDAVAYHAGLEGEARSKITDDFRNERVNIVCATVAFGMGIDRGDVRCVVHAAMPKSIEHYQQETGRAGRDGLAAECVLLHSAADLMRWKTLVAKGAEENNASEEVVQAQHAMLEEMHRFVVAPRCRHRTLSEYFGQEYRAPEGEGVAGGAGVAAGAGAGAGLVGCGACDVCLGELKAVENGHDMARKIISCVARCGQAFGAGHVAEVLLGGSSEKVRARGHDKLSTYGLLRGSTKDRVVSYINQLIDAGALARSEGEYPVIMLTPMSSAVLKNQTMAALVEPAHVAERTGKQRSRAAADAGRALTQKEQALFESLRAVRRALAQMKAVPPYVICGDVTLEEMCRVRPTRMETLIEVRGIGVKKADEFGARFIEHVRAFSEANGLETNVAGESTGPSRPAPEFGPAGGTSGGALAALPHFMRGASVDEVAAALNRRSSTVWGYMDELVAGGRISNITPWVDAVQIAQIDAAAEAAGSRRLKPIFDRLEGKVGYEAIRLVMALRRAGGGEPAGVEGK